MNLEKLKTLRKRTQASYAECKKALNEANQDLKQAERILMEKGLRMVDAVPTTNTEAGIVHSYIHPGNRVGVLIEAHCQTDFVAKTDEFKNFTQEIALQVASMKPTYISRDDIDDDELLLEHERRVARLEKEGNPGHLVDELAEAEMVQWFAEVCLLEQTYVKNNSKIVKELLAELVNKVGEPCRIKRFVRWEIGADNGEIRMSKPKEEKQSEENLEEMKYDLIRKRFRTGALILLGALAVFLILLPLAC